MAPLLLLLLLPFAAAQNSNQTITGHELYEVKLDDKVLLALSAGKEFSLPQLRVYDRKGQQVADFGSGFDADGFREQLENTLRSPSPKPDQKSLQAEVQDFVEKDGKPLRKTGTADFTIVEYWAEWCEACHAQARLLKELVSAQPNLSINIFHVEADPMKIHLPGVVMKKEKK